MLDNFTIAHRGGFILWSRSFTPAAEALIMSSASPVNSLIREALIEGREDQEQYEKDGYTVRWSFINDLELIFAVAYQRILQLTYVDDLLAALKTLFVKLFQPFLTSFVASLHANANGGTMVTAQPPNWNFQEAFKGWDKVFDRVLRELEGKANQERRARLQSTLRDSRIGYVGNPPSDGATTPTLNKDGQHENDSEAIARNVAALKARARAGKGKKGGRGGKGPASASGSESDLTASGRRKAPVKVQRKWVDNAPTEDDMVNLDYSVDVPPADGNGSLSEAVLASLVDESSRGTRGKDGLYEVKDWEFLNKSGTGESDDDDDMISRALNAAPQGSLHGPSAAGQGYFGGLLSRLTGGKVLTKEDLTPALNGMKNHLMTKNVAREIAEKVCESVGTGLEGKKVGGFKTIKSEVRIALSDAITRILTPKTSTDVLLSIRTKLSSSLADASQKRAPYSMTFVGVNGVGKSTNLSKVAFWLLQNDFRVLIAACDTFRSGAVEQLRVHVRNLGMLVEKGGVGARAGVELYERGYGKDAAGIAKDSIAYAKDNGFDVVLIDTAGRMQDNEPLMRALAKLVATNNPDKIIFVGEALVGNEAVDQLTKFDRALKDFSASGSGTGQGRGIDGMLVTKWDTVDDKVGAALSMTYVTGQPILFVGCGQTYTDLRQLRVSHVVQALLSD